jgi:hypothetical protein
MATHTPQLDPEYDLKSAIVSGLAPPLGYGKPTDRWHGNTVLVLQGRPATGKTTWTKQHKFEHRTIDRDMLTEDRRHQPWDPDATPTQMEPFSIIIDSQHDLRALEYLVASRRLQHAIRFRGAKIVIETNMNLDFVFTNQLHYSPSTLEQFTFWSGPGSLSHFFHN